MIHEPTLSKVAYCGFAVDAGTRDEQVEEPGMAKSFLHYHIHEEPEAVYRRIEALTPEVLLEVSNELFLPENLSTLVYR